MRGSEMVTKAIQRIGWRFSKATEKDNTFTVNQNDIDALNSIAEYIEQTQNQQFESNELFAKMYVYTAMRIMENDKSTVYDNNHRRKIGNLLEKPLSQIIENLTQSLNDSEMYFVLDKAKVDNPIIPDKMGHLDHNYIENVLNLSGCSDVIVAQKTLEWKKEREQYMKNIMEIFEENPEAFLGEVWSYESVKDSIIAEVNNMINIHK